MMDSIRNAGMDGGPIKFEVFAKVSVKLNNFKDVLLHANLEVTTVACKKRYAQEFSI